MFLTHWFTALIYQPFLNILVFFYWVLGLLTNGHPDMGIAVILLAIIIRIVLLPLSLAEDKSEKDRREMTKRVQEIQVTFSHDPIRQRAEMKRLFHKNRSVVIGEMISFVVQLAVSLMLWRMFATGLTGEDLHLLYPFMPNVQAPFTLVFLGRFDLTHSNIWLNFLQSIMIFVVETASILTSPYPPMKGEVVRLQLVLPIVSFLVFMYLPAGKKLFIITALVISLGITIYKFIRRKIADYAAEQAEKALAEAAAAEGAAPAPPEKVLVQTK